jgi:hypothetical protein
VPGVEAGPVGWGCRVGAGSPFTDTAPDQAAAACSRGGCGCGWVEHISLLVRTSPGSVPGGLAHCWVLRRHLLWVLLGAAPGLAGLTRGLIPGCVGVCLCGGGCGVRGVVVC